jgi:hypothetical protein
MNSGKKAGDDRDYHVASRDTMIDELDHHRGGWFRSAGEDLGETLLNGDPPRRHPHGVGGAPLSRRRLRCLDEVLFPTLIPLRVYPLPCFCYVACLLPACAARAACGNLPPIRKRNFNSVYIN